MYVCLMTYKNLRKSKSVLILSIRDSKAEAFNRPFFSQTRATAMREIQNGLEQDKQMKSFAFDFSIYEIGSFDITNGHITSIEPHHVCNVIDLITEEPDGPELEVEDIRTLHG